MFLWLQGPNTTTTSACIIIICIIMYMFYCTRLRNNTIKYSATINIIVLCYNKYNNRFFVLVLTRTQVLHTENVARGANREFPKCRGGAKVYTMY